MTLLRHLKGVTKSVEFQERWLKVKEFNKKKLAQYIHKKTGYDVPSDSATCYTACISPIRDTKRFLLSILYCIQRYNEIKVNKE